MTFPVFTGSYIKKVKIFLKHPVIYHVYIYAGNTLYEFPSMTIIMNIYLMVKKVSINTEFKDNNNKFFSGTYFLFGNVVSRL